MTYTDAEAMLNMLSVPEPYDKFYWVTEDGALRTDPEARLLGGCLLAYLIECGDIEEFI